MIESIEFLTYRQQRVVLPLRDPWGIGVAVKSVDGLSATKVSINTTELALTDVAIFNGARAGMRNLKIKLAPLPMPDIETSRQRIYSWFQIKQLITVYITLGIVPLIVGDEDTHAVLAPLVAGALAPVLGGEVKARDGLG